MLHVNKTTGIILSFAFVVLGACSPGQAEPTLDPAAVYTQSVQTVAARMTMTAEAIPDTPTPTSTPQVTITAQTSGTPSTGATQAFTQTPATATYQMPAGTMASNTPMTAAATGTPRQNVPTPAAGGGGICDSAWISEVGLQNGAAVAAGSQFTKTWLVKNTGTCTWTTGFQMAYGWGENMNGQNTALPRNVNPGEEIEISVVLTAPSSQGQHGAFWRLRTDTQVFFGETFPVIITVP